MPLRRNMNINDVYECIMSRMKERLDQFVDQFANRMNDMMNPRRHGDRNGRRNESEESENLFFEGDGSSLFAELEECEGDGVALSTIIKKPRRKNVFVGKRRVLMGKEDSNEIRFESMLANDPLFFNKTKLL
ncbi:hypothetical protein Tco_1448193 [Tanacetum coccineum]